jgi:hypothetical protein
MNNLIELKLLKGNYKLFVLVGSLGRGRRSSQKFRTREGNPVKMSLCKIVHNFNNNIL